MLGLITRMFSPAKVKEKPKLLPAPEQPISAGPVYNKFEFNTGFKVLDSRSPEDGPLATMGLYDNPKNQNTVVVHANAHPLHEAMKFTDWLSLLLPSIAHSFPTLENHMAETWFSEGYGDFQQACLSYAKGQPPIKFGRLAFLTAPLRTVIASDEGTATAGVNGVVLDRTQYPYLLRTALRGNPYNFYHRLHPKQDTIRAAMPNRIEHNDYYTVIDGEWAIAYWSLQVPYDDIGKLLRIKDLNLWVFFEKEYHPDRGPDGNRQVKDFYETAVAYAIFPSSEAKERSKNIQIDLSFIPGTHRLIGKDLLEQTFKAILPGAPRPSIPLLIELGARPLWEKSYSDALWDLRMDKWVSSCAWPFTTGTVPEETKTHPLSHAQVVGGISENGSPVLLNWYYKNILFAQETKAGKTAFALWQILQFYAESSLIVEFIGAKDQASHRIIPAIGGTVWTIPYEGIFIDAVDDPDEQLRREMIGRRQAEVDFDEWLKKVLRTGSLLDFPLVIRPERETQVYFHYVTRWLELFLHSWEQLSAINPVKEAKLPNIFPGRYIGVLLDDVSALTTIEPPPDATVFYPWRIIQNFVNLGLNRYIATWVSLHNPEQCPKGFKDTFTDKIVIDRRGVKFFASFFKPRDKTPWLPDVDITLNPTLKAWLSRDE